MRHRGAQYLADADLLRTLLRHIPGQREGNERGKARDEALPKFRQSEKVQAGDLYRQQGKYRREPADQQF